MPGKSHCYHLCKNQLPMNHLFRWSFLLLFISLAGSASARIMEPVSWSFSAEQLDEQTYELQLTASVDSGWHIYAQELESDGPVPTAFTFQESDGIELIGGTEPDDPGKTKEGKMYGGMITIHKGQTVFRQKVKVADQSIDQVAGKLEYMTCTEGRCLPPSSENFSITLPGQGEKAETDKEKEKSQKDGILKPVEWSAEVEHMEDQTFRITLDAAIQEGWRIYGRDIAEGGPVATQIQLADAAAYEAESSAQTKTKPANKYDSVFQMPLTFFKKEATFTQTVRLKQAADTIFTEVRYMSCDDSRCLPPETKAVPAVLSDQQLAAAEVSQSSESEPADRTLWGIFIAGFAGGLLAFLTPCVFPMVPLTVSFFTKNSGNKAKGVINAAIYGISIIAIYLLLGFLVTKLFGSSALNQLASNIWFNLSFFVIFLLFALSFFGLFEITLPSSWINKSDRAADRGGYLGIFFMAFTLALVSFSCTGPIIGTLLVQAAVLGSNTGPLLGMLGFSLALALPFTIFAAFPGWLNNLPKSGGWLNTIKVVLGFLELGLALKFLSNVDMAYSWGILPREIFLGIWMIIGLGLAAYLFGLIRFPHDSKDGKVSYPSIGVAVLVLGFVGYVGQGLTGQSLTYLSGFPPPTFYSINSDKQCPQGFNCFHSYEKGMAYAKKVNKPVMLDFTGWSCVNCRKMEENVWIKPGVEDLIDDDYVLISLYVDEKKKLPKDERYVSDFSGEKITTVGGKWSDFQASRFRANSQPYYVLLDHQGDKLLDPKGYTPDAEAYQDFLKKGISKFKQQQQQAQK